MFCHVPMGLFEAIDTYRVVMVAQVKELLLSYNLLDKLITYVKDEKGNLSTVARTLSSVVSYVPLKFATPQQGSCFGHVFNKTCQYVCNDATICLTFWEVNLEATHLALQKTITWTKKFNKGRSESKGACFDVGLHH